ncbi:hypothetical protein EG68_00783 [Paragonimus skrjabini miyazakii]|uniref:Uncharacterized protein n=1 Tax=Paragonimus skrjabini miyazakii TaxID=59628 RepID=A0A8S9Z5G8_9TREM|nr:hypothetical protein EG68_00783 [Paragonimus skrjabini miyazakii]
MSHVPGAPNSEKQQMDLQSLFNKTVDTEVSVPFTSCTRFLHPCSKACANLIQLACRCNACCMVYAEASAADCRSIVQKLNKECAERISTQDLNELCDSTVSDKVPVSAHHSDCGLSGFVNQHSDRLHSMENTHQYTDPFLSDRLLTTSGFENESEYKLGVAPSRTFLGDFKQASDKPRSDLMSSEDDSNERVHFENSKSKWDVYL